MSFLGDVKTDGIEESGDFLGGSLLDSDMYDATVKLAYALAPEGKARSVTLLLDINGTERRFTEYVTNRSGEIFYKKGDKKYELAGFQKINELSLITTGKSITQLSTETKEVKRYNPTEKKETVQPTEVLTELLGKNVKVCINRSIEDKTREVSPGKYEPNGETFEKNEISKFVHPTKGITVTEAQSGITEPTYAPKWLEQNKGKVRNNSKADKNVRTGSPNGGSGSKEPAKNLFDD